MHPEFLAAGRSVLRPVKNSICFINGNEKKETKNRRKYVLKSGGQNPKSKTLNQKL